MNNTASFLPVTRVIYGNATLDVYRIGSLSSDEELFEITLLSGEWPWGYELVHLCFGEQPRDDHDYNAHTMELTDTRLLMCVDRRQEETKP